MTGRRPQRPVPRRRFCQQGVRLLGAGAALPLLTWLPACGAPADEGSLETRVPLALIPVGGRLHAQHGDIPVEVIRQQSGYLVRSLLCTHQGCEVQWQPESKNYFCPCHEGRFDANGEPIQGPPRRALRILPATVEGADLVIHDPQSPDPGNPADSPKEKA